MYCSSSQVATFLKISNNIILEVGKVLFIAAECCKICSNMHATPFKSNNVIKD